MAVTKLKLPDVTLVAIDTNPALAIRALQKSMEHIDFAEVILFTTDWDTEEPDGIRVQKISTQPSNWPNWYCEFLLRILSHFIRTTHLLKVEWDGYVVNADAWCHDFLNYDYIGAPWDWHKDDNKIGNGGFSLRSKRLLETTASLNYNKPVLLDDVFIGRTIRDWLVDYHDIKIAPVHIAKRFSHERLAPESPFGFHGLFNFWRYHSDPDMLLVANQMPAALILKPEFTELIDHYQSVQNNIVFHHLSYLRRQSLTTGIRT